MDRQLILLTVSSLSADCMLEGVGVDAKGHRGDEERDYTLIGLKQVPYCVYTTCHRTVKVFTGKAMNMVVLSHMQLSQIQHRACIYFDLCQTIVKMVLLNNVTMTYAVRSGDTPLRECKHDGQVVLHIVLRIRGGGMGGGGGPPRPAGFNTTSTLEASRDDEDGSADFVNPVFIGSVKPVPQQDVNWHANMTAQDVNAQIQWQGDWDVLERRMGDLIVVLLNSTGRMDPKMDNGQTNASSRLPYVFLIESGAADMVAIADAQVDSAK